MLNQLKTLLQSVEDAEKNAAAAQTKYVLEGKRDEYLEAARELRQKKDELIDFMLRYQRNLAWYESGPVASVTHA